MDVIRRIWCITGEIALPAGLTAAAAIDRLSALFSAAGTRAEHTQDCLSFTKNDPASQDRLAVFDKGVLHIAQAASGPVLRYRLTSRIMLACFLAPLLFLAFAQIALVSGAYFKAQDEAAEKLGKARKKAEKADATEFPRNPIDIALGAPAPRTKQEMAAERLKEKKEPPSATPAYVFAGLFAALYLIGRFLEGRLARKLFTKALNPG